jgi:uncharacterized protein YndB with AHSA1/START domain
VAKEPAAKIVPVRIEMTLPAPRDKVFRAWTEPKELKKWFTPCDESSKPLSHAVDLKVGGKYRVEIRTAQGRKDVLSGIYREVRPPEKLVYSWKWTEEKAKEDKAAEPGDTMEGESRVTVLLRDLGGKTELILTHDLFANEKARKSHDEGWRGLLDGLTKSLRSA